jgi:hypothetical protein
MSVSLAKTKEHALIKVLLKILKHENFDKVSSNLVDELIEWVEDKLKHYTQFDFAQSNFCMDLAQELMDKCNKQVPYGLRLPTQLPDSTMHLLNTWVQECRYSPNEAPPKLSPAWALAFVSLLGANAKVP